MTSFPKDASVLPIAQSLTPPDLLRSWVQQVVQQAINGEFGQQRRQLRCAAVLSASFRGRFHQ